MRNLHFSPVFGFESYDGSKGRELSESPHIASPLKNQGMQGGFLEFCILRNPGFAILRMLDFKSFFPLKTQNA